MPDDSKTVRVFISSTFRDMHAERDHLVTVVFPELRERVEQLGLEFFDVDLRWGVPARGADGETANSWEYCRQWIDRVEPFFVCILGQRYGWVPTVSDFKNDEDRARQMKEPRSITDLEVRHAVLDSHRKRRSYFYLRETLLPALSPEATDEQLKLHADFVDPPELLQQLDALKADIRQCRRPVRHYDGRWTGKEFADLDQAEKKFGPMVLEDLWSGVLRDERYVSKDIWREVLHAEPDTDPRYTDESQPVPRELWEEIVKLAKPEPLSPLDADRQQMEAFAQSRLRWFQGRITELKTLTDFISSNDEKSPHLAAVVAVPGQGKSALLAKLSTLNFQPSTFLISHFVGATERSANAHTLVERLLGELDRSGIVWPAEQQAEGQEPKRDFNSLCLRLAQRLGDYAGERRIVILLDALNQLSDGHDLQWLPHHFGPGVRAIISCVDEPRSGRREEAPSEKIESGKQKAEIDQSLLTSAAASQEHAHRILRALASRHPAPLPVPLGALTPDDVRTIVVAYLNEYCKILDTPHVDALCAMPQARNPLYLLVMLAELRTLGGNEMNEVVPKLIASMPQDHPDTVSLFRWVLQRLEVFNDHAPDAVRWWCLYLAHGRAGMASHELADLLARKLGPDAAATALRIERGLRRYLQRRGPQLDFFHGQLRQAVFEKYGPQAEAATVHSDIATYFRDLADPGDKQRWKMNARALAEMPYHLSCGGKVAEVQRLFSSFSYLAARVATGQVYEQLADFALAGTPLPSTVAEWRDFLKKHTQRLDEYPAMLVPLTNHEGFPSAREQAAASEWSYPWLKTSLEVMPPSAAAVADGLRTEVVGSLGFPRGSLVTLAVERGLVFRIERLGVLRMVDVRGMRLTDTVLSIRHERPLLLACSPDANFITVFYESGEAELYHCASGADERPARLELVTTFQFHLPECEDPVVVWHDGTFWFQARAGALAHISTGNPQVFEETLLGNAGELSALVFTEGARLVALRQGGDTLLLASGAAPLWRRYADVSTVCSCGAQRAAVAFTDGTLAVYDLAAGLATRAEERVGIVRGALGWDGMRLLWLTDSGGFFAWRPKKSSPLPVQDNEEVFPRHLHVLPRWWSSRSDGTMLLVTTHSIVAFRLFEGGATTDGRLMEFFGGSVWRVVHRRDVEKEQWLIESQPSREVLLRRGVLGRLYCAPDGKGQFFAASGYGPGLVHDLATLQTVPIQSCPPRVNMVTGDPDGGCWLVDGVGDIFFVDAHGFCRPVASINLPDVTGAQIHGCGDYLVWYGYSTKFYPETGVEAARTMIFFRRNPPGSPPGLERIGERLLPMREGICQAICYDRPRGRLVTVWTVEGSDRLRFRLATVEGFIAWRIEERELTDLGPKTFRQAVLSPDGHWLGVLNAAGEFSCVRVADGRTVATLAPSTPFGMVSPGASGAEFWLVTARIHVYRCELLNPV